jgi:hypothetical protein
VTPTSSKTKAADQKGVFVGEGVEGSGDSCGGGDVSEEGQDDGGTGLNGCAGGGESSAQETDVIEKRQKLLRQWLTPTIFPMDAGSSIDLRKK